ncbi:MAG: CBS domain-containing protein [Actinomycetota bacterium]
MRVEDVMTRDVVTVREDAPFRDIVEKLLSNDISGMPVVDGNGRVVGIVSESDLLAKEAFPRGHGQSPLSRLLAGVTDLREGANREKALGLDARDLMSGRVIKASPEEGLPAAARRMLEHGVKRLPVIKEGRLVGLISRHDVLRVFATTDGELAGVVSEFLRRCMYVPPDHLVRVRTEGGVVTLEGTVQHESDIRVVGSLVAALDGVIGVENHLLYRYPDPKPRREKQLREIPHP